MFSMYLACNHSSIPGPPASDAPSDITGWPGLNFQHLPLRHPDAATPLQRPDARFIHTLVNDASTSSLTK